jgi:hypothetical protein
MNAHEKRLQKASAILEEYEEEANVLDLEGILSGLKEVQFHAVEVGEDNYTAVTVDLTERGLRRLYALVRLEGDIILLREKVRAA